MGRTIHVFDLIIIGGGTAGLSALHEGMSHTDNILLIHDGPTGTTCARTGCMPSKALIHAAHLYHDRGKMSDAGIKGTEGLSPDIPAILKQVQNKRNYFVDNMREKMSRYQAHILNGRARLESPTKVRACGRLLHAKNIIIATGSSPYVPDEFLELGDKVITTDNLFEQKDLPSRMGVIGLGPVGLEMAQALARLGIEVTAVSDNQHIGGIADKDISNKIVSLLKQDMAVWMGVKPDIALAGDSLLLRGKDQNMVEVDKILVAAGRRPNLDSLGLKRIGVPMDSEGVPHFNRNTMQINGFPIFLAGDATDERAVLHEAIDEGTRAAQYALGDKNTYMQRRVPLSIIFTHPNIAVVGDSSYALRRNGVLVGEASFTDQGRATIENDNEGKIRISANEEDGMLRSCEMMAPDGEHLAHLMAFAIERRLTAAEMLEMPYYHPTIEEALKSAVQSIEQQREKPGKRGAQG